MPVFHSISQEYGPRKLLPKDIQRKELGRKDIV
jgi:hypothetical protein